MTLSDRYLHEHQDATARHTEHARIAQQASERVRAGFTHHGRHERPQR